MTAKYEKLYPFKLSFEQFNILENYANERNIGVAFVLREFIDSLETNPKVLKERILNSKLITKLNEEKLKELDKEKEEQDKIEQKEKLKELEREEQDKADSIWNNKIWKIFITDKKYLNKKEREKAIAKETKKMPEIMKKRIEWKHEKLKEGMLEEMFKEDVER